MSETPFTQNNDSKPRISIMAVFSLVTGSCGLLLAIVALIIGRMIYVQAADPANNAMVMSKADFDTFYAIWITHIKYFIMTGSGGLVSSVIGFLSGLVAVRNIKSNSGRLSGYQMARAGRMLGLLGAVMSLLVLCAAAGLAIYALAHI